MKTRSPLSSRRGSALIVAMIFSIVLAVSIGTYTSLTVNTMKMSNRSYHSGIAMNVAEAGLEEGLWNLNRKRAGKTAFNTWDATAWTIDGNNAIGTFTGFLTGGNETGTVKVWVKNIDGSSTPKIIAKSTISLATGAAIEKWIEITLASRSTKPVGLQGRYGVSFSGNNPKVFAGSSDTDGDRIPDTAPANWTQTDKGVVSSMEVTAEVDVINADIYGTASVAGPSTDAIEVGPNGLVGPYGTTAGTKPGAMAGITIPLYEKSMITESDTPTKTWQPVPGSLTINSTEAVGDGTRSSLADGDFDIYYADSLNLTNKTLTVTGQVVLVLKAGATTEALKIGGGSGEIVLGATIGGTFVPGRLIIVTDGDISIAGQGVANQTKKADGTIVSGFPKYFEIWGTSKNATAQSISVSGNGNLSGVITAPNANVTLVGGGSSGGNIYGAISGRTIKLTGNVQFGYDKSLEDADESSPYKVAAWRELTTTSERATYSTM